MCGIVAAFGEKIGTQEMRQQVLSMSKKIRHRGPDWSGIYANNTIQSTRTV